MRGALTLRVIEHNIYKYFAVSAVVVATAAALNDENIQNVSRKTTVINNLGESDKPTCAKVNIANSNIYIQQINCLMGRG